MENVTHSELIYFNQNNITKQNRDNIGKKITKQL